MWSLSRAVNSGIPEKCPEPPAGCREDEPTCRYLTDGTNLYRHLGAISTGARQMVGLENCRTLDLVLMSISELRDRLRPVVPRESFS